MEFTSNTSLQLQLCLTALNTNKRADRHQPPISLFATGDATALHLLRSLIPPPSL